ncbi:cobyrinic acid a,c-diamide synthase [Methanocella sp. CWC-04]|uniref:Cobyrinate a,c-diamide synthase n=1 Tax=Methanooceanicella nereidis TaxID=2052831 RepID=A0AAP2RGG9_9EURY|nr:cobyrinate a,c-diamide synthase [Methanocella sp. CWC-04]MCD1295705.1 cobyrinic acid a,c-diamide synthase [Methanocella sp. CWC-04]
MDIPRIVIAGTHSGCGKTTISSGLMAALTARGMKVQPFKVGPDFIDPTHHTAICGRPSRNLDPFMMGEEGVLETFRVSCRGADVAVIEGVMGMYDGLEGTDTCSTAHVSKILSAPVLLVVDVNGMSRSANALIKGYTGFDPDVNIAGVIFNNVGSPRHREMITASMGIRALGWMPRKDDLSVSSRHLGLKMAGEVTGMNAFGKIIEENCDVDAILDAAGDSPPITDDAAYCATSNHDVTIGIAMDDAFCFYYRDNFDRLIGRGAKLKFFSPIADRLPVVDAIYLGGGYPELYAEQLGSSRCRDDVKNAVDDGMPVYAECGGLMYLTGGIVAEKEHKMAGVLPAMSFMTKKLQSLGYVDARFIGGPSLLSPGISYKGHEFHYSKVECESSARFAIRMTRGKGIMDGRDGMYEHNAMGSYTHAYFNNEFADSLLRSAYRYNRT